MPSFLGKRALHSMSLFHGGSDDTAISPKQIEELFISITNSPIDIRDQFEKLIYPDFVNLTPNFPKQYTNDGNGLYLFLVKEMRPKLASNYCKICAVGTSLIKGGWIVTKLALRDQDQERIIPSSQKISVLGIDLSRPAPGFGAIICCAIYPSDTSLENALTQSKETARKIGREDILRCLD